MRALKEFEEAIISTDAVLWIIKKTENSPNCDKELVLAQVKINQEEWQEKFSQEKLDREWESTERGKDILFELEKLKVAQVTKTMSLRSSATIRSTLPKFL